jgi:hypothetical protein
LRPANKSTRKTKAILQDAKRPIVIFNRVGTTVDSVSGQEVGNRQEVQFLPRLGVAKKNELLTSAASGFASNATRKTRKATPSATLWYAAWLDGNPSGL